MREPEIQFRSGVRRYTAGILALVVAFLLRWALNPLLPGRVPYISFSIAVLWAAWFAGVGPALLAAAGGGVAGYYSFAPAGAEGNTGIVAAYFALCGVAIAIVESQRRARLSADRNALLADDRRKQLEAQVTRRERAEAAEVRERQLAQQTLESIADAVIAADPNGRIDFINSMAGCLTGWNPAEAAGKDIDAVFQTVDDSNKQPLSAVIRSMLNGQQKAGLTVNAVLRRRDGGTVPVENSAAPIRNRDGAVTGAVVVFRDVSARQEAERRAAHLAAIVNSSLDAIIGKGLDGIIQTWNQGAERIYGYKAEEAIGKSISIISPQDRLHEESEIIEHMRSGDRLMQLETVRVRKDGTPIQVALTISPIRNAEGKVVGISHMARDITRQKQFEEQLRQTQRLESLGVLAGGLAHDFNNLLTGIMGNASLAAEMAPADEALRERLHEVVKASERAADLVRQMLAYSGKGRFVIEPVDLSSVVGEIATFIRTSTSRKVELHLDLQKDLPRIEADVTQIQQVVMNLVINAAEAVEDEQGTVTVRTATQEFREPALDLRSGRYVMLEVTDTGIGMDDATQARIFEPFFTTKFTGRGLGLSAVMGIVRGHHGSIQVRSTPGVGSTFTVLFPAVEAHPGERAGEEPAIASDGHGTILVIDDEEIVRRTARFALDRHGYTVLLAENGRTGVEAFAAHSNEIAVVVLDLTMPVMSGEEALRRIQEIRPDARVVLSSGFNETEALRRFAGRGLAGFLQKPYTARRLLEKINAALPSGVNSPDTTPK